MWNRRESALNNFLFFYIEIMSAWIKIILVSGRWNVNIPFPKNKEPSLFKRFLGWFVCSSLRSEQVLWLAIKFRFYKQLAWRTFVNMKARSQPFCSKWCFLSWLLRTKCNEKSIQHNLKFSITFEINHLTVMWNRSESALDNFLFIYIEICLHK